MKYVLGLGLLVFVTVGFLLLRGEEDGVKSEEVSVYESYDTFPGAQPVVPSVPAVATSSLATIVSTPRIKEETLARVVEGGKAISDEGEYLIAETDQFLVYTVYHAQLFTVVLKKYPDSEGLRAAERYFIDTFELTAEEVCMLHIDVYAPKNHDPLRKEDLGLPTCPGPKEPENWKY